MKPFFLFPCALLAAGLALACKSSEVTDRETYQGGPLPRPDHIVVYDFAASPEDLPTWVGDRDTYAQSDAPIDPDHLAAARRMGGEIAEELVERIEKMGMNAVRAEALPEPALGDIMLVGYFGTIDEGSAAGRVLVGFGEGSAEVSTHVEGYRMTDQGPLRLGRADVAAEGKGKGPGLVVPLVVFAATANLIGLVVSGAVKATNEVSGRSTTRGAAGEIAERIASELKIQFDKQGWL